MAQYVIMTEGNIIGMEMFTRDEVKKCEAEGFQLIPVTQYGKE